MGSHSVYDDVNWVIFLFANNGSEKILPVSSIYGANASGIPAIFENAKSGRKKTGNHFLISCLGVPFRIYGYY